MYLCSENKGADQLRGYSEADLSLISHRQKAGYLTTRFIAITDRIDFMLTSGTSLIKTV